jgi:hypothetical protein
MTAHELMVACQAACLAHGDDLPVVMADGEPVVWAGFTGGCLVISDEAPDEDTGQ